MSGNRYCVDCAYMAMDYCMRPTDTRTCLVTGKEAVEELGVDCETEREHVSWIARALGNTDCGVEAIHFKPKQ